MIALSDARVLLKQLDGKPADAIESETIECKPWDPHSEASDSNIRELRQAVVCLANARGGTVFLGIADRKRTRREAIQGVGALDIETLRRKIYDGTAPSILVDIQELVEPEGRLLLIHVPRGMPPHTTSEGIGKIRVGKECKPLTGTEISRLLMSGGQRDLTAEPLPGATREDLDPGQIELLRRTLSSEGQKPDLARQPDAELLGNLGLVQSGAVTFGAVLLLGKPAAIARWIPQHEVLFLRFKTPTRYDVRHDLKGPLLDVLDTIHRILEAQMRVETVQSEGFQEITVPDVTWWAAREAVLNALIHRDYFVRQSVQIELRDDRLTVSSPGGFVGGVAPENILRHPPVRRNPLLAGVFQAIGLVNRAGLGVDRIYEELLRLGKGLPRYQADESHVLLTLPIKSHPAFLRFTAEETLSGRKLDLNDLILIRAAADRGLLDRWSAAQALQLSEEDAADRLVSLRGRGYLLPSGRGRGTSYRLSPSLSDQLRGPGETDVDIPLDDEAIWLRIQAVLAQRGRLTNADVRRISGYSRSRAIRLMRLLQKQGLAILQGRGRAAVYAPGPNLPPSGRPKSSRRK